MKTPRFWVFWGAASVVLLWYLLTDPNGGLETLARLQWLAWITVISGPVYLLRRALMDQARSGAAFRKAMESPTGAGLVYLGLAILTGLLFLGMAGRAQAEPLKLSPILNVTRILPDRARLYLPMLKAEQGAHWAAMPIPTSLAGQVEQETCASLQSSKCWNPKAELKTTREYGFGLGQLTVTPRFDNFAEARKLDPSLRDWHYADRFDATRQLRTMVLMDKGAFQRLSFIADSNERLAMTLAAYNGGLGGVLSDRRLCASVPGCDANRWFDHVERHSLKNKIKQPGYGLSFFDVNRGYVRSILLLRRFKYEGYWHA